MIILERLSQDNFKIILRYLKNILCDPSLEPSQRDGSNDGSQCTISWRINENYQKIIINYLISSSYMINDNIQRPTKFTQTSHNQQLTLCT